MSSGTMSQVEICLSSSWRDSVLKNKYSWASSPSVSLFLFNYLIIHILRYPCAFSLSVLQLNLPDWQLASYNISVHLVQQTLRSSNTSFFHTCDLRAFFFGAIWLICISDICKSLTHTLAFSVGSTVVGIALISSKYSVASTAFSPGLFLQVSKTALCNICMKGQEIG